MRTFLKSAKILPVGEKRALYKLTDYYYYYYHYYYYQYQYYYNYNNYYYYYYYYYDYYYYYYYPSEQIKENPVPQQYF